MNLTCPSFLSVYVTAAIYGRRVGGSKILCDKKTAASKITENCLLDNGLVYVQQHCHGEMECSLNVSKTFVPWSDSCVSKHINELTISYNCGKIISMLFFVFY